MTKWLLTLRWNFMDVVFLLVAAKFYDRGHWLPALAVLVAGAINSVIWVSVNKGIAK